jgi:hypothetical protein
VIVNDPELLECSVAAFSSRPLSGRDSLRFREVVIAWCDGRSAIWSSEWQRRLIIAPSDRRHKLGRWGQTASGGRSAIFIMSSEMTRPTAWSVSSCSRRGRSNRRRKSNQNLAAACCGVGGRFWHGPAVRGNAGSGALTTSRREMAPKRYPPGLPNFRTKLSPSPMAAYLSRSCAPRANVGGKVHTPLG